ncbi:MAG: 16S rRNA (cytidine(1402)-2'-O)-methyltransferase [Candidatus Scatovivens sp.]
MSGKLYLIATPIGNLEDITIRALKTLEEVDLIAAEDTRHTLKLLNHFNISKPLISYYKQMENTKSEILIKKLLEGKNIGLVSDAGTPGISDPGEVIVKEAIKNNIEIIPIPGACALVNALIASGINTKCFKFIGFLPVNKNEKKTILQEIKYEVNTLIFYEAPHKLKNTLSTIYEELGDRECCLAKEITKIHEEFIRGKISKILENIEEPKGEFVIIIEGNNKTKNEIETENLNKKTLEEHYKFYEKEGLDKKEIIKKIAKDRNVSKNEIYKKFLEY